MGIGIAALIMYTENVIVQLIGLPIWVMAGIWACMS